MAIKLIQESTLTNIANAIRAKTGKVDTIAPPDMPNEILSISGGGSDTMAIKILDRTITSQEINGNEDIVGLGAYSLYGCNSLVTLDLPNVTNIQSNAVISCTNLRSVRFLSLTALAKALISPLVFADLGILPNMGAQSFLNVTNLKTVILRKSNGICTLANTNAFQGSGMLGSDARIYVPQALIPTYQTATNWSTLYASNEDLFQPLEGSPYESTDYTLPVAS